MGTSSAQHGRLRTRWAAIGAAIAVTLGTGGIGLVSASVSSGERSVLIPISSCRIIDVRPDFQVGPKASPLGPSETMTVSAHGDNGDCTGIPSDAVALSLNVTALDATSPTFLTVSAAGIPRPVASSLNPSPGAPPTPNAVTTELSPGGQFNVFNRAGSVNVFIDVNGYYVDHDHDDRYGTKAQVAAKVAAAAADSDAKIAAVRADTDAKIAAVRADTDAKIATTELAPTVIDVGIYEMFPAGDGSGWRRDDVYTHTADGSIDCLVFPIDPVAGQFITGMSVTAISETDTQLALLLTGLRSAPGKFAGPGDLFHYAVDEDADLPKSSAELVSATAGPKPDAFVQAGFNYTAMICAIDVLTITGAQVTLANP